MSGDARERLGQGAATGAVTVRASVAWEELVEVETWADAAATAPRRGRAFPCRSSPHRPRSRPHAWPRLRPQEGPVPARRPRVRAAAWRSAARSARRSGRLLPTRTARSPRAGRPPASGSHGRRSAPGRRPAWWCSSRIRERSTGLRSAGRRVASGRALVERVPQDRDADEPDALGDGRHWPETCSCCESAPA